MAKVKVILEKGEKPEEAEELLYKALESKRKGDIHSDEFEDPAIRSAIQKLDSLHREALDKILREVFEKLDKEYSSEGF